MHDAIIHIKIILNGVITINISDARHRANEKYNAKAYDEIKVRVPKGGKEVIQAAADRNSESVNGFINRLIAAELDRMGIDTGGVVLVFTPPAE